ncbi:MAG: 3-hydroxybutyryl-CoA dehydrogenase [Flavobacteriia bacterium]|nr:3-hydroxybutyryl-CoA dehydrogenase [Flavobacteriia bacterium]
MKQIIGVLGAGTMGAGIAQVAAQNGNQVILVDVNQSQLDLAKSNLSLILSKLIEKEKISISDKSEIESRITYSSELQSFAPCQLIIEAILEDLTIKHKVFAALEEIVSSDCILASNTSSLSIASIGSVLKNPSRVIGIHFFNPAPLMPLVEIIPAVQTAPNFLSSALELIQSWKKITVVCKDTPGFIVNRVARPFYGEALRIYDEGIADFATIDWAMTNFGGFKMGPFALMDYIGNDVNYAVTESVFSAFYFDSRFKPSFTQKRLKEAGFFGRKSGRGFYDYSSGALSPEPTLNNDLGLKIFHRILLMLINEAIDAVFMQVASKEDVDLAMTKGVNYPKGLLAWADEIGLENILNHLQVLFDEYGEDRYRPNPLLRQMVKQKQTFF